MASSVSYIWLAVVSARAAAEFDDKAMIAAYADLYGEAAGKPGALLPDSA